MEDLHRVTPADPETAETKRATIVTFGRGVELFEVEYKTEADIEAAMATINRIVAAK
jgi:hypothetical protein